MNRLQIEGEIGRGEFGVVFAARVSSGQRVAVKKLRTRCDFHTAIDSSEVRALCAVRGCPNIVQMLEMAVENNYLFIVMERYGSDNLLQLLQSEGRLSETNAIHILRGLLRGVDALHAMGFMHRDVKPENVLFRVINQGKQFDAILCDLGSATQIVDNHAIIMTSSPLNPLFSYVTTRFYRSPEMVSGCPYGKEIDVWALGCVGFEMLTGRPLFPAKDEDDLRLRFCAVMGSPPLLLSAPSPLLPTWQDAFRHMPTTQWKRRSIRQAFSLMEQDPVPSDVFVEFLDGTVTWDPTHRWSPTHALAILPSAGD